MTEKTRLSDKDMATKWRGGPPTPWQDTRQREALVAWRNAKRDQLVGLCQSEEAALKLWARAEEEQRGAGMWAQVHKFRDMLAAGHLARRSELATVDLSDAPRVGGVFETKMEVNGGR